MSIATISDIHIKNNTDDGAQLLLAFFNHPKVVSCTDVYFLGDIFDLMIGSHDNYYDKYNFFFDGIKMLIEKGVRVFYFSGNHDFHLKKLFEHFVVDNNLDSKKLIYSSTFLIREYFGKKYFFSHGDDIEIGNPSYKRYKAFITSKPLAFLADYVVPYSILNFIGENASRFSRKNNQQKYSDPDAMSQVRLSFRDAAKKVYQSFGVSFIICGHSHIEDQYQIDNDAYYLNNGYSSNSRKFIYIDNNNFEFIKI